MPSTGVGIVRNLLHKEQESSYEGVRRKYDRLGPIVSPRVFLRNMSLFS